MCHPEESGTKDRRQKEEKEMFRHTVTLKTPSGNRSRIIDLVMTFWIYANGRVRSEVELQDRFSNELVSYKCF